MESFTWTRRKVFSDSRGLRTSLFLLLELRPEVNRALATLKCRQKYLHMPLPLSAPLGQQAFHGDIELFIASNERNERLKRSQETKRRLAIVVLRTDTRGNGRSRRRFRRLPREFAYEGATLVSKVTNVGLVNATALNTELAGIMKKIGKKDFSM